MSETDPRVFRARHRHLRAAASGLGSAVGVACFAAFIWLLFSGRGSLLDDLRSPGWSKRSSALVFLALAINLLVSAVSRIREGAAERRELKAEECVTAVVLDDAGIAITDRYGSRTTYPWFQLEEVLVFPQAGAGEPGAILLVGGDRQGFVPALISEREELLAEIIRRGRLGPKSEGPEFRRYARAAADSPE